MDADMQNTCRFLVAGAMGFALLTGCSSSSPSNPATSTSTPPVMTASGSSARGPATTVPTTTLALPVPPSTTGAGALPYPPKTLAEFKAFAHTGDPTRIHPFASDSKGLPSCPKPNLYAVADPGITGRQLEADESALFVQRGFADQPCGAFLFLFHSATEDQSGGYTVGRVAIDGSTSDPQRHLEVDIGDVMSFSFDF